MSWSCTRRQFQTKSSRESRLCWWRYHSPLNCTAGYAKTNLPAATTLLPAERDFGVRDRYRAGRYSPTLLIKRPTDIWISPLENCRFHSPPLLVVPVVCLSPSAECSSHRALHSHDAARSILGQPLTVNVSSVYR